MIDYDPNDDLRDDVRNSPGLVVATVILVPIIAIISTIVLVINLYTGG